MKKNLPLLTAIFLGILFYNSALYSANNDNLNKKITKIKSAPGKVVSTTVLQDGVNSDTDDLTEMIDVIVEFKDAPLFSNKNNALQKMQSLASITAVHQKFDADIKTLQKKVSQTFGVDFQLYQKKTAYYKLFNGVSIKIPKVLLSGIASFDYVKKIHPDNKVKIDLKDSVPLIKADSVWTNYNDEGDSVIVAILDTGIDYLNPALGGGFGPGYKVIGGYDFANKDADPMDDHWHGTHVSGIVAANGDSIKGVAPKALLLAVKVIKSDGNGSDSDVLSGIEYSVDPNGDNNYDDKVDVINMSLGGTGSPDDPLCTAINNAVELGVVCCVASGNDGGYNTVNSPGMAEKAITVGASDKSDKIGYLSSRGPNRKNYYIKPEILAPGIGIVSTYLHNATAAADGTSMAAPHVAGVCALIKHKHKDWTPEMIKSAIMTSSKDLGLDVMTQGAGRVDALKTMAVSSFVYPSQLNFGMDMGSEAQWLKSDTVIITNTASVTQNYSADIAGLVQGITLSVTPGAFTLAPGTSQKIIFNLNVDNTVLPYVYTNSLSYGGMVNINGSVDKMHIPWAFVKTSVMIFTFEKPVQNYIIFTSKTNYKLSDAVNSSDFYSSEILLPKGKYNMFFAFLNTDTSSISFVHKEDYQVDGYKKLTVGPSDAPYKIGFNGINETGQLLTSLSGCDNNLAFVYTDSVTQSNFTVFNGSFSSQIDIKSSSFSSKCMLVAAQSQNSTNDEMKYRFVQFPNVKGLQDNLSLKNGTTDYLKQNISLKLLADGRTKNTLFGKAYCYTQNRAVNLIKNYPSGNYITQNKWEGILYFSPSGENQFFYAPFISADYSAPHPWFETDIFRNVGDSMACFSSINPTADIYLSPDNGSMSFGESPVYPNADFWSMLSGTGYAFNCGTTFSGQLNELRGADIYGAKYQILDTLNRALTSGTLENILPFTVGSNKYRFVCTDTNYFVNGFAGKGTLQADFDFTKTRTVPPIITSLKILNAKGVPVNKFVKGEKGIVVFSAISEHLYITLDTAATKVYARKNGTKSWLPLNIIDRTGDQTKGMFFTAALDSLTFIDSAFIDLRIVVGNKYNVATEWTLEPAFTVGNIVVTTVNENAKNELPHKYDLKNNYPNPFNPSTVIKYSIPVQQHVELKIYDMLGREVAALVNKEEPAGEHQVNFNAGSLSSGVYIYRLKAGGFINSKKMMIIK